jgi:hydrogenase-4 component F
MLGSAGTALALLGTIVIYFVAQDALGQGLAAMAWDRIAQDAQKCDPRLLSLGFVLLLAGYGTGIGLVPFHGWMSDALAAAPTPVAAIQSGLLLNLGLYALIRFKMILAGNAAAIDGGRLMIAFGLVSLASAAVALCRARDLTRLFGSTSVGQVGVMSFAFGMGGAVANVAGLLQMAMHPLVASALFFTAGHVVRSKATPRLADIRGLSVSHPVLAVALALAAAAAAALPPSGMFTAEFLLVSSSFARQPWLAVLLAGGLLAAFGALMWRMQGMLFGEPDAPAVASGGAPLPLFAHLALVLIAGVWLPDAMVRSFRLVAGQLG